MGNTSLTSIANDPTTDRYSFKLEFDYYVDGQTCFSPDKLILNNNYADATNMKEALDLRYVLVRRRPSLYNFMPNSPSMVNTGASILRLRPWRIALPKITACRDSEFYKPTALNIGGGENLAVFPAADDMVTGDLDLGDMTQAG